jgi:hypothetical protein
MAPQQNGWNVVSTTPAPDAAGGWNVVSTKAAPSPQRGFFGSAADSSGLTGLVNAISHPIDTIAGIPSAVVSAAKSGWDNAHQEVNDLRQNGLTQDTRRKLGGDIPVIGPALATAQAQHDAGNNAGMAGTLTGLVGGIAAPEGAMEAARAIPGASRALIAGDVTKPIGVSGVSALDRFNSAKLLGVNLDAADATNGGLLKAVKSVNENSLAGSPAYEGNRVANTGALHATTNDFLNDVYPGDRESGGATIQNALKANQQDLRSTAEQKFQQLTDETKGQPMQGSPAVGQRAQELLNTITPLADKYPSLAPSKTMNVLGDLSGVGSAPKLPPTGFLDSASSEFAVPRGIPAPSLDTFSDLQKLRSATHDLTTTNPDLVKSQAIAPLQQMTSSLDNAMTDAASGLTPEQTQTFRDANSRWLDMKGTYDDPSSPLYHAVRSPAPSKLFSGDGLGAKTPEVVRNLQTRLGPDIAPLQRGVIESALKPTGDGIPNYKSFGLQLNRIPADYRNELLTPDQQSVVSHIANTSNILGKDFNPSGSAKLGQKIGEMSAAAGALPLAVTGHPLPLLAAGGYNAAQYGASKLMNSPSLVNWLMKQPAAATPFRLSTKIALPTASLALRSPKLGAQ